MSWSISQLQSHLSKTDHVIIELGCGPNPPADVIGIDLLPLEGVHFVANLEEGLSEIPSNCADEIRSRHFMEHLSNFDKLLTDIHRILKPGGIHNVVVPHFSNPYYYSDYTHKRFFGLYSFDYFSNTEDQLKRKVPAFYGGVKFKVIKRKIVFKNPDFFIRNQFNKRILTPLFNLNSYMQELYESSFCWIFPCQEISFEMIPIKD